MLFWCIRYIIVISEFHTSKLSAQFHLAPPPLKKSKNNILFIWRVFTEHVCGLCLVGVEAAGDAVVRRRSVGLAGRLIALHASAAWRQRLAAASKTMNHVVYEDLLVDLRPY